MLVYLRLIAVTEAMKCKKIHRKHRKKSIFAMWIMSAIVNIFPPLAATVREESLREQLLMVSRNIVLHGFHTIPIICIIGIYVKLIYEIQSKNEEKELAKARMSEGTYTRINLNNKLSTKMIKGVAICLIVCYLPYLAWWQYSMIVFRVGSERNDMDSDGNRHLDVKTVEVKFLSEI